jgi:hypothetical protein
MADGTVQLILRGDEAGCHAGDVGSYELTPSASGLALHVRAGTDACAVRRAAFAGEWTRMSCPSQGQWCLGDLDAGQHVSINYVPFVKAPDWQFDYGRFAFTVPDGWRNTEDASDGYDLVEQDGKEDSGIYLFADVLAHAQSNCDSKPASGIGSSAASIYAWIRSVPGLKVTNVATDVTLGGLHGYQVDLAIDPKWTGTCPWMNGLPVIELFVNAQYAKSDQGAFDWGIGAHARMRLFILDLGADRTLAVDIEAPEQATWDALVPKAMPVVQSFEFRR